MIMAAALRKSDGNPTRLAIMKSAGEQSAGQASLQGFSSHDSHLRNSSRSWASVMLPTSLFNPIAVPVIKLFIKSTI